MNHSPFCSCIIFSWLHLPLLQSGAHAGLFQPHVRVKSPLSLSLLSRWSRPVCPASALEAPPHPCPAPQHFHWRRSPPSLLAPLPGLLFLALSCVCALLQQASPFTHVYIFLHRLVAVFTKTKVSKQTTTTTKTLLELPYTKDTFSQPCCFLKLSLDHFPFSCQSSLKVTLHWFSLFSYCPIMALDK